MVTIVNGVLLRGEDVLMAHRSPQKTKYPNSWSFPGGHVEDGESLEKALSRELSEEIGIRLLSAHYLERYVDTDTYPEAPSTFHFFRVEDWQGDPTNCSEEHTQIRWLRLDQAIQMQSLTFSMYRQLLKGVMTQKEVRPFS